MQGEAFQQQLAQVARLRGISAWALRFPVNDKHFDPQRTFLVVQQLGGYQAVCAAEQWREVAQLSGLDSSAQVTEFVKATYELLLLPIEDRLRVGQLAQFLSEEVAGPVGQPVQGLAAPPPQQPAPQRWASDAKASIPTAWTQPQQGNSAMGAPPTLSYQQKQLQGGQVPLASHPAVLAAARAAAAEPSRQQLEDMAALASPRLLVAADLLQSEGIRMVSALRSGIPEQQCWALNALCALSCTTDVVLADTPGLLQGLLKVVREGLAASDAPGSILATPRAGLPPPATLPPSPRVHLRHVQQRLGAVFPDRGAELHRLQAACNAAVAIANVACVPQNHVLLLDLPCLRLWAACMDAARQPEDPGRSGAYATVASAVLRMISSCLAPRMLLAAFGQDGLHLICSILRLLAPAQHPHVPPSLVEAAAEALVAVAAAFPPNTDTLLQLSGVVAERSGSLAGHSPVPAGAHLALMLADVLVSPYALIRRHAEERMAADEAKWDLLMQDEAAVARSCCVDAAAVLMQVQLMLGAIHLAWALVSASDSSGVEARIALASCHSLMRVLCDVACHAWPSYPPLWQSADVSVQCLRFLQERLLPVMRQRALLIRQLRAHAAGILALLFNNDATRPAVSPFEGRIAQAAMSGVLVPSADDPGIVALLSFFASS